MHSIAIGATLEEGRDLRVVDPSRLRDRPRTDRLLMRAAETLDAEAGRADRDRHLPVCLGDFDELGLSRDVDLGRQPGPRRALVVRDEQPLLFATDGSAEL